MRRMGRQYERNEDPTAVRINRDSLKVFRRILIYIKPYRGWMTLSIIALLFSVALGLILPLVIQNLVDVVLIDKNLPRLNQLAIGLLAVLLCRAFLALHTGSH